VAETAFVAAAVCDVGETVVISEQQPNDLVVLFAYRDDSDTPPAVPSGRGWTTLHQSAGSDGTAHTIVWRISVAPGETIGDFAGATLVAGLVMRSTAGVVGVGADAPAVGSGRDVDFAGLTLANTDGTSLVAGFMGRPYSDPADPFDPPTPNNPPPGMGNEGGLTNADTSVAINLTTAGVTSWTTQTADTGTTASDPWRSHTVEITLTISAIDGSGDLGAPAADIDGVGFVVEPGDIVGTGDIGGPTPGLDGTIDFGFVPVSGSGAIGGPAASIDGAAFVTIAASGDIGAPAASIEGFITEPINASGDIGGPAASVEGFGVLAGECYLLDEDGDFLLWEDDGLIVLEEPCFPIIAEGDIGAPAASIDGNDDEVITATGDIGAPAAGIEGNAREGRQCFLLKEDGSYILLEDGSRIAKEAPCFDITATGDIGAPGASLSGDAVLVPAPAIPKGRFVGAEVWTDLACNAGVRIGWLPLGTMVQAVVTQTVDNRDTLTIGVPLQIDDAATLTRGRVVRLRYDILGEWEEFRVLDVTDDSEQRVRTAVCDGILQDLARAVYTVYDGTGQPRHEFSAVGIDAEGMIDGPILETLADADITYVEKGTVQPTETFDIAADYTTARGLIADAAGAVGAEVELARDGETRYLLNVVQERGAGAPLVYARNARNLLSSQRVRNGSLGGTRVVPRGADDSTSRGIGYAYWEVTDIAGNVLTVRDPRGAGFPSPLPFAGMAVGWQVLQRGRLTPIANITASEDGPSAGLSRVTVTSATGFTVGMLVEFVAGTEEGDITFLGATTPTFVGQPLGTGTYLAGDCIFVWEFRAGSSTIPTTPTGYTEVWSASSASNAAKLSVKIATASGSDTIFGSGALLAARYRGVASVGAFATASGTSASLNYPALTIAPDRWMVAFGGHASSTTVDTPPTGLVNRTSFQAGGSEIAVHDSNGPRGSWPNTAVAMSASGGWRGVTVQLVAGTAEVRRLWNLGDPAAQAAQAGIYDRILDRPTLTGATNYARDPFVRDFTGETALTFQLGNGGQVTASTSSATVTGSGTWFNIVVQPGDKIYVAGGATLLGTVQSVESASSLTLTANALANATASPWVLAKPCPLGGTATGVGANVFTEQVDSDILGVAAKAWRIYRPLPGGIGTASITYRLPAVAAPDTATSPMMYWVWCDIRRMDEFVSATFRLRDADTNATLGGTVTLDDEQEGQQVRVMLRQGSSTLSSVPRRVLIEMTLQVGASSAFYDVRLGPWGAQPAGWSITDIQAPRANDLWHEGTLWLANQGVPESYNVSLADLAGIDGSRFPYERLTLGGRIDLDDRQIGVRSVQRLVSLTRDLLRPGNVQLVLGRRERGLAEFLAAGTRTSVSDVALRLSRGLLNQAQAILGGDVVDATSSSITAQDAETVELIGDSLRQAFRSTTD
jgi:hypothetical protein